MKKRPPAPTPPPNKPLLWAVVVTAVAAEYFLIRTTWRLFLDLQRQTASANDTATRLLAGMFVMMCLGGFVGAAGWTAFRRLRGKTGD